MDMPEPIGSCAFPEVPCKFPPSESGSYAPAALAGDGGFRRALVGPFVKIFQMLTKMVWQAACSVPSSFTCHMETSD